VLQDPLEEADMALTLEYEGDNSLTDFEIVGLDYRLNLADGHAYQDLCSDYRSIIQDLPTIWETCERTPIPELQYRFCEAFALLANSPEMVELPFKICPTASNSIEIVGDVLAQKFLLTRLVEPTFDNLALILQRRRVKLAPLSEDELFRAAAQGNITELLDANPSDALFLVQPNNPTGRQLDAKSFSAIVECCATHGRILVLDNTFRFFNRQSFNDFAILRDSGVTFMALEDTGKVWPTHDLKASLLFCSADLEQLVSNLYHEIYLCHSRFALAVLERFILKTTEVGLQRTIWARVDKHRALLRSAISDTDIVVDPASVASEISVEWLNCRGTGLRDFELTKLLAGSGLTVLPGRQFFWQANGQLERQFNVRLSLMKPFLNYNEAMAVFRATLNSI
jgi:bifunctional pyridoxal-dependent enzyme with beta-cystathionase and maltose regulon repressor activities